MFPTHNLILDFESLGTDESKSVILDCSAIVFDSTRFTTNPYTFNELLGETVRWKLEAKHQIKEYKWEVQQDALRFWNTVDPKALKIMAPSKEDLTVTQFNDSFLQWLNTKPLIDRWWSRGNTFDIPVLWRLMKVSDQLHRVNNLLPFWKVRDIRTFIESKLDFEVKTDFTPTTEKFWKENFIKHSSQHDVVADVLRIQAVVRAESELEYTGE